MRTLPELDELASAEDPRLTPCDISIADGTAPGLCGTLVVPENYDSSDGPMLSLPIRRARASNSTGASIAYLGNGPGQSNFQFQAPRSLLRNHDLIQIGYRGVDSSVSLSCDEVAAVARQTPALTDSYLDSIQRAATDCLIKFRKEGHELKDYGVAEVARDLVAALDALDVTQVHLLADGFGLQVAIALAATAPKRVARVVALSPAPLGPLLLSREALENHMNALSERYAECETCSLTAKTLTDAVILAREKLPSRWGFSSIDPGRLTLVSSLSLLARESTLRTLNAWVSGAEGSYAGLAMVSWLGDNLSQNLFVWGDALAKSVPLEYDPSHDYRSETRAGETLFGAPGRLLLFGAAPPTEFLSPPESTPTLDNKLETLIVNGSLDPTRSSIETFNQQIEVAQSIVLEDLVLASEGWGDRPDELARMVVEFFDDGHANTETLTRVPWIFSPTLEFATMQWIMTAVTIAIPVVLFAVFALLFRRVKRTIDADRRGAASRS